MSLIVFEDEQLLVVNKPAGMNTHSPSPFAGEGVYEWLKNREPRWATLAIIHRLDKETSGLIVFTKTPEANRSLTEQFEGRRVHKKYILVTDRPVTFETLTAKSCLVRVGEKYVSRPVHAGGEYAETRFSVVERHGEMTVLEAEPVTGRTHQIRVHAADHGFAILGDTFYGGADAERAFLHAGEISFAHPKSGEPVVFSAEADFKNPRQRIREAVIEPALTDAYRVVHGAADGWPGLYVDRLGDYLLAQSDEELAPEQLELLRSLAERFSAAGVYFKPLRRLVGKTTLEEASPKLVSGKDAPEEFTIKENGVRFALRFGEGYSVGLFLDQRDNRRRFLTGYVSPGFEAGRAGAERPLENLDVLNTFAYTCGFSVCAAKAGARVTSLDLSKKYLEWGKRNFELNGLDLANHDFIFGDAFEWMRRLGKKGRMFDCIILDPPTFSRSKEHGVFRAEKDYAKLVRAALALLKPQGALFASANAATLQPDDFLRMVDSGIVEAGRIMEKRFYVPQPPDFPLHRAEPAHLKTAWVGL